MGLVPVKAVRTIELAGQVMCTVPFCAVGTIEQSAIEGAVMMLALIKLLSTLFEVLEFFLVFRVDGEDHSLFAFTRSFAAGC